MKLAVSRDGGGVALCCNAAVISWNAGVQRDAHMALTLSAQLLHNISLMPNFCIQSAAWKYIENTDVFCRLRKCSVLVVFVDIYP